MEHPISLMIDGALKTAQTRKVAFMEGIKKWLGENPGAYRALIGAGIGAGGGGLMSLARTAFGNPNPYLEGSGLNRFLTSAALGGATGGSLGYLSELMGIGKPGDPSKRSPAESENPGLASALFHGGAGAAGGGLLWLFNKHKKTKALSTALANLIGKGKGTTTIGIPGLRNSTVPLGQKQTLWDKLIGRSGQLAHLNKLNKNPGVSPIVTRPGGFDLKNVSDVVSSTKVPEVFRMKSKDLLDTVRRSSGTEGMSNFAGVRGTSLSLGGLGAGYGYLKDSE